MMKRFSNLTAVAAPFRDSNINTDIIMPKRFLKVVNRDGLAAGTFADIRDTSDETEKYNFVLNLRKFREAEILVVGDNFGCGSSREHAVWGLLQIGVKVLIGTSFGGIFFDNCRYNGLFALSVPAKSRDELLDWLETALSPMLFVSLPEQKIRSFDGQEWPFEISADQKTWLLNGQDMVDVILEQKSAIENFEQSLFPETRWLSRNVL